MPETKKKEKITRRKTVNKRVIKASKETRGALTVSQAIGLFLLSVVIVSFVSIFSFFAYGLDHNLLGVWVGDFWSKLLLSVFGMLPTFILLFFLIVVGLWMVSEAQFKTKIVFLICFVIFYLDLCMLLNINNTTGVSLGDGYKGTLGFTLNSFFLKPVFGQSPLGYYLICIPILVISISRGFGFSLIRILSLSVIGVDKIISSILNTIKLVLNNGKQKRIQLKEYRRNEKRKLSEIILKKEAKKILKSKKGLENLDQISVEELAKQINWDDPLEVRRYRDKEAELRRIKELNQWEIEQRQPTFAGTISKVKKMEALSDSHSLENVGELEEETINLGIPQANLTDDTTGVKYDIYKIIDLKQVLEDPPKQPLSYSERELKEQAAVLEEQLANFKVMGKVVEICTGPVIVRYEVELAPGVKVSRVAGLADDLALSLKAKRIRILAPIPGKSVVGIEVPSLNPQIVYIKDVLLSMNSQFQRDCLEVVLGKSMAGDPVVIDLAKAPHLLIAGQTGSGKSVCINTLMVSILGSKTPDQVRMILIDPKVVELKPYDKIPHLLGPVIHQPEVAVQALQWATYEMDRRYGILSKVGARNIIGFNDKFREGLAKDKIDEADLKLMPYIIIVIDELADLMMVAGKDVETSVARIAQKARAVGIHLVVATQRPSTNVITGTIKANLPTRIAFQVASYIDSRTIIDKSGAEKLLGRGDMLYRSIEAPDVERVHGAFVSDQEAEDVAKACSSQFVNYPQIETFDLSASVNNDEFRDNIPRDSKFEDAAELVCSLKQGSASLLQRKMAIGYARAGRLIDQLEEAGIVGPDRGSKPRLVLMNELELQSFLFSGLND